MSVVFIRARHTAKADEFDRLRKSDASLLLTDAATIEDFSIELTLGGLYDNELSEPRPIMYAIEGDTMLLPSGSSAVVEVAECIRVPNNMYGLVMPKGQILLEQGILMASTKIEPSFNGRLRLLLFNTSRTRRTLRKGAVIASAVFYRTEKTLIGDQLTSREPVIQRRVGVLKSLSDFVRSDIRYFIMLLAIVLSSSVAAVVLTILFGRR